MSFGFSVGDFIAIIDKARELRDRFTNAPAQFKAISNEVSSLTSVLKDIKTLLPEHHLTDWQEKQLKALLEECHNVVTAVGNVVNQYSSLEHSNAHGIRGKAQRTWKRLMLEPKDIQELRSRMHLNVACLGAFTQSLTSKVAVETQASVKRLHERQDNRERSEEHMLVHNWLSTVDYGSQQSDYIQRRGLKTGDWLLVSQEFRTWLGKDKQTLFCPGIPGAGKTILTAIVIEHVIGEFSQDLDVGIAYIYCNFRERENQQLDNLLASLLLQLSRTKPSTPRVVAELYERHDPRQTRPSTDELSKALQSVAASYTRVFIIVDALDECQTDKRCRDKFLSEMFAIQEKCNTSLLMTARFIPDITSKFDEKPWLEIRATREDIERYLDSHMKILDSFDDWDEDLQEEIKGVISQAVDGMFLLAKLYLDALDDTTSAWEVRKALKQFQVQTSGSKEVEQQKVLDGAYDEAMRRIADQKPGFRKLAQKVLYWIVCGRRPLTTSEIQTALAVDVGDLELNEQKMTRVGRMVSVCAGLVTVDEECHIIRLVHYTTQEYFRRTQARLFPTAEADITAICATYLSFDVFRSGPSRTDSDFEERLHSNQLYDYAARNWGHHARNALDGSQEFETLPQEETTQVVLNFIGRKRNFEAGVQALFAMKRWWARDFHDSQNFPRETSALHLAAYFGIKFIFKALLNTADVDPDIKDGYGQTPLHWVAENGHEAIMKLLLDTGSVDPDIKDGLGRTLLHRAARNGHEAVVKLLLDTGSDPHIKDGFGQTPLHRAAENGHEAVVELLLNTGSDPNIKDDLSQTPLHRAAENGHKAVIKLLLDTGSVDPDIKDGFGRTPLYRAAGNGHEAIVKLLLDTGSVDPNVKEDDYSQTPLHWAAGNGHEAIVQLLLDTTNIDIDQQDFQGQTPAQVAYFNNHSHIEHYLIAQGASIDDFSGLDNLFS